MVGIAPLPLPINSAYLLVGERPVLVDADIRGEEQKLLDLLHQHGTS